jgi:hypothetical protein
MVRRRGMGVELERKVHVEYLGRICTLNVYLELCGFKMLNDGRRHGLQFIYATAKAGLYTIDTHGDDDASSW